MVNIGERVRFIREKLGLNQAALAAQIGLGSATVVSRYESNQRQPDIATLVKLAELARITVDELLTGEEVVISPVPAGFGDATTGENRHHYGEFVCVPQVNGSISAGGGLVADDSIEMRIAFRREWIQRRGDPQNMSLIRVSGDSMEPTLLSGDLVLIDHGRNFVDPQGGIYAIALDDSIMIKRLQVIYPAKTLKIISDNSRYEPLETVTDQVRINGKVIWFGREIER